MPVTQLPLAAAAHNNQQLFSDYYLNEILPNRPDWLSLTVEAATTLQTLTALFDSFVPSTIEAQTEEELIKPVLRSLGHTFEVQPALVTSDGTKKPDYILYSSESALQANKGKILNDELLHTSAFAVADAKYWNRPLDVAQKQGRGDAFSNRNPSFQISFYIQQSGMPWGILTNGRLWRLYHRDTAHKLDRFYEVNLEELVRSGEASRFLYFYTFFRRLAFEPGPLSNLSILQASTDFALRVGEQLKEQVFESLRHLAQGFLDYAPNNLQTDPVSLREIYENSLILLYRLLFVFYAEARELLPVQTNSVYRDSYSLRAITKEIADNQRRGRRLLPSTRNQWPRLQTLFEAIDRGSPPLTVATFNGGLFDASRHPFLEHHVVGDYHLERAIDTLARVDGQFVDYRDLAELHLGTIYEGLLEYELVEIEPDADWQVDLVNDRGERKKTGSYYTPNYIVKYIVDKTVGPVLDAAVKDLPDDQKIDAILRVNVVDPAMGSGYFLVEVTEYIARYIVNLDLSRPDNESLVDSDLAYWKRRVVQSCVYGVDLNPLAVELAKLSLWLSTVAQDRPLSFLDHHLRTGNSLVGSMISEETLPTGNKSKQKRRQRQIADEIAAGQQTLTYDDAFRRTMSSAVGSMSLVERSEGANVADVKDQERIYQELHESLTTQYGQYANLLAASRFGMQIDESVWSPLADFAMRKTTLVPPSFTQLLQQAQADADRFSFFHWDLEFPEVFYDREGRSEGDGAGFDAVVGNPPYVRQEKLTTSKPFFKQSYQSYASSADLFIYFFEKGMGILRHSGRLGFITSGTFARSASARQFRAYLPSVAQLEQIIDFGENQPFRRAEMVRPTISILRKAKGKDRFRSLLIQGKIPDSLDAAMESESVLTDHTSLRRSEWTFQVSSTSRLADRLASSGPSLKEVTNGRIFRGVTTGDNDVFFIDRETRRRLIDQDHSSAELIKPMMGGLDLRPWYSDAEDRFMIFPRQGTDIRDYPAIEEYLSAFRAKLEPKPADWPTGSKWEGRKEGSYRWYEIQDTVDYFREFEKPKIVYPDIAKLPRFSWDESNIYLTNSAYMIPDVDFALLGLLQSRAMWFYISQTAQLLRLRGGLWQYRLIQRSIFRLPVPQLGDTDKQVIEAASVEATRLAGARYALHQAGRKRIRADLAPAGRKLNNKLNKWWTLDFSQFRTEVKKAFRVEIPVRERDEWSAWLENQREVHESLTQQIIAIEEKLNDNVYRIFGVSRSDREFIEKETAFSYGEV